MTSGIWLCLVAMVAVILGTPVLFQKDIEKAVGFVDLSSAPAATKSVSDKVDARTFLEPNKIDSPLAEPAQGDDSPKAKQEARLFVTRAAIEFGKQSVSLSPAGKRILETVAQQMKIAGGKWEVQGHSDGVEERSPQFFSESRARYTATELNELGIPREMVVAKGYGATRKVVQGNSKQANQRNRRITFRMLTDEKTD